MINIPGYTIHSQLGVGGMATVYRATQDSLRREVALKVVSKHDKLEPQFKKRFIHEGHDLASLQHPNIATIYDISQTDDYSYYAMELLKGGSLTERMMKGLSLDEAFKIIIQIGEALDYAHENQIIHRDLKPGNILFRDYSTPILTDFGIAKNINRDTKLTQIGVLVGTPSYMSPEQCRARPVDGNSDQYSLCILFFEMITGYLPFDADDPIAIATKQVTEPVPKLPEKLRALQPVINIAMDKEPEQRYTSVGEFCRVLKDLLENDKSLKPHLLDITRRISDDDTDVSTSFKQPPGLLDSIPDPGHAQLDIPTAEEFWNEPSSRRTWLLTVLLLVTMSYGAIYYYDNYYMKQTSEEAARFIPVLMRQAERQVAASQLLTPAGNNALESLSKILEMDPENRPARQMLDDLATTYEIRARDLLNDKNYPAAETEIINGLRFVSDHKGLISVQKQLNEALNEIERKQIIAKKLKQIDSLFAAKQYIKPANNNAASEINKVLALDPENEQALAVQEKIETIEEKRLKALLDSNKLSQLSAEIKITLNLLPNSLKIRAIKKQLDQLIHQKQTQAEVASFLQKGDRQLKRGNLNEPSENNALYHFKKAQALLPESREVKKKLQELAEQFNLRAQQQINQKQFSQALVSIDNGLRADQSNSALLTLRENLERQITRDKNANQQAFSTASKLLNQGNIVLPESNNGYLILRDLLKKRPEDRTVRRLLESVPSRLEAQIREKVSSNQFAEVEAIYAKSLIYFPQSERLLSLKPLIAEAKTTYEKNRASTDRRLEFQSLVAKNSFTTNEIQQVTLLLNDIKQYNDNFSELGDGLSSIAETLQKKLNAISSMDELSVTEKVLTAGLAIEPTNRALTRLKSQFNSKRLELEQLELAKIDKMKVPVRIIARPWAHLSKIIDEQGNEVVINEKLVTPLNIRLLPGKYKVTLSNPSYKQAQSVDLTVTKVGVPKVDVAFGSMTARSFFETVNY
ncbi:protein kinase [Aliikangiella marina]|uniref:Protein kinase n=1 Tax=Aliikangiella marina TaxID=1712262 RepID=A0A545T6H6_9GAMM|nr:serine/threonine-protein kinase [Aliikangiella marina]TQV72785.1 protein kinase [Aliikangiella marina]